MKEVRTGIVGMGIGKANARGIVNNPRGRVVALCDVLEERMHEFARELPEPVKLYTDYKQMCRDPEIDAIFIGTPNQLHVPLALEAIKNDKHVLVTKPLADAVQPAKELVEAAEAAGVVNMMSLSTRYGQGVLYLSQLAQRGEFGELYYARARSVRRSGIPFWSLGFIQQGGGAFRDMGVHVLDSVWWMLGTPKPVSVTGVSGAKFGPYGKGYMRFNTPPEEFYSQYAADDYAGGFIRFENDVGLQVESFWACHQAGELQIELFGTEAGARLTPLTLYRTVNDVPQDISVEFPGGSEAWTVAFDRIADHFIECILDGVECQAPLRHGLIVQEMMEALLESAATGVEVRL
jgi:predicted dehydrogenase